MTSQSGPSAGQFSSESVKASATIDTRLFLSNLLKKVANDKNADGNGILRSIEDIAAGNYNVLLGGTLQTALKTYSESGSTEKDAYKSLVNLSNRVLNIARQEDIAAKLDEHLQPEDPRRQIEFIRYDGLPLAYDWGSNTSTSGESPSPYLMNVKSDVLIVMKDAISDYKASQASVRGKPFDPNALPRTKARHRIGLKDVLCCIKVQQRTNWESTPPVPQSSSAQSHSQQFSSKSVSQVSALTNLTSRNTSQASTPPKISQIPAPTNPLKRRNTQSSTGAPPEKYQKVSTDGSTPESVESHDDSIQTAHYASVLLSRGPYTTHTLGINIDHDNVRIYWSDRQGTISTEEFNISRDFVLFATMIITFSRFSLADWGITPELYPINGQINYSLKDSQILQMNMTVKPLCHRVCLYSRGTMVLHGKIQTDTSEKNVVVKISHPEKRRVPEPVFVRAGLDSTYKEHFAELHHNAELGPPTGDIRAFFGLDRGCERQCRMIVFEPLSPITSLRDPKHIARVWLDCLRVHREMWVRKYEHNDISLSNLMYRETGKGADFEVVDGNKRETRQKGKGTTEGGSKGEIRNESEIEGENENGSEDSSEDGSEWGKDGGGQENKKGGEDRNDELMKVHHGVMGILHDWDLAKSHNHPEPPGIQKAERTGTIPFIALDIAENLKLPPRRRYRHDLESFGWCLLYLCLDCDTNQEELYDWDHEIYSGRLRLAFLFKMHEMVPREGFADLYCSAQVFMKWLMFDIMGINMIGHTQEEKSDGGIWDGVCNILRDEFDEEI